MNLLVRLPPERPQVRSIRLVQSTLLVLLIQSVQSIQPNLSILLVRSTLLARYLRHCPVDLLVRLPPERPPVRSIRLVRSTLLTLPALSARQLRPEPITASLRY